MAFLTGITTPIGRAARTGRPRAWVMLTAALAFVASAWLTPQGPAHLALLAVGLTFFIVFVWLLLGGFPTATRVSFMPVEEVVGHDSSPAFLTAEDGGILYRNAAAADQFDRAGADTLAGALQTSLVNPGTILFRLQTRAAAEGAAAEDIVINKGHLRIAVHRAGTAQFLWRIERSAERPVRDGGTIPLPMITLGRNDTVLFMNPAARALIGERVRSLDRVFPDAPFRRGEINSVTTKDGSVPCFVSEIEGIAGRREILLVPGAKGAHPPEVGSAQVLPVIDDLPVALLMLTAEGRVVFSTPPARELLGVSSCDGASFAAMTEGLGRPIADWIADAAADRGTIQPETLRVRRPDRDVFVQVRLSRACKGGEPGLIAVLTDATEFRSLEEQFVQSQKMQAIGQLAGGIAHDFNNLLTAISGHCDLLLLRHDQGAPDYADLMQIHQNANRAAALVGQLLAYSRKQTLRPEVIDLRDALSDLAHLLNRLVGEKVTLALCHDPALPPVRADKRQLEQVIMNLVVNARDAMRSGGEIRIKTEQRVIETPLERDRAVVAAGRYVCVKVCDEGEGIPPDKLRKIFDPFYTTKRVGEGTGLGLSTAYGIVKQSGGFIFADSTLGEGTCFQILLPAHDPADTPQSAAPQPTALATPARNCEAVVLLVEDEAPVRAFASRALQLRGLTVLEAASAEEALELLGDPELQVDAFVTDVVMPGLDGPSWIQRALVTRPDVKVVFMSGYSEDLLTEARARIPNSVFLPKPFSLGELTDTVLQQIA